MAKPARVSKNIFYVGHDQQSTKGTGVAPVYFPQYFDGDIAIAPERSFETYTPATSQFPELSLMQKFAQPGNLTIFGTPQMTAMYASYFLGKEHIKGSQPDTPVASTVDGSITTGDSTFDVAAGDGSNYSAGDYIQIVSESDTYESTGEIVKVESIDTDTITPETSLVYAHSDGDVVEKVEAPFYHKAMYETREDMPWFSTEVSAGYNLEQTNPVIVRLVDCRMNALEMSCESGMPLKVSPSFRALDIEKQASEQDESYESNKPFRFFDGTYTLDSSTTTNITNFSLSPTNRLDEDDYTNSITPADLPVQGREGTLNFTLKFDEGTRFFDTYFASGGYASVISDLDEGDFNVAFSYGSDTSKRECTIDIPKLDHVEATLNPGTGDGTYEYSCSANLKKASASEFMTITTGDDNYLKYIE